MESTLNKDHLQAASHEAPIVKKKMEEKKGGAEGVEEEEMNEEEKTFLKPGRLKPPIFFGSLILSSLILGFYLVDSLKTGFFPNRKKLLFILRLF